MQSQVPKTLLISVHPQHVEYRRNETQQQQYEEEHENLGVGKTVQSGTFEWRGRCVVLHEFRIVPGINYNAEGPFRISQHGATQQKLIGTERHASVNGDRYRTIKI